jgi:uncharacterized protein (TIGR02646 family)
MIRIDKSGLSIPSILSVDGLVLVNKLKAMSVSDRMAHKFNSRVYGHKTVKDALRVLQNGKCCFCEAKVSHISHGDVEHFRPKAAWKAKEKQKLTKPGYYWLAYDFSNLYFSCQICNQLYKKNYFPLSDPAMRAQTHDDDLTLEDPLIVDPGNEDPAQHLMYHREIVVERNNSPKGRETISRTGLNRPEIVGDRFEYLSLMQTLAQVARGTSAEASQARAQFKTAGRFDKVYSTMIRENFPDLV